MGTVAIVKVWGILPDIYTVAQSAQLNFSHVKKGVYGLTTTKQLIALPGATIPLGQTGSSNNAATIPADAIFSPDSVVAPSGSYHKIIEVTDLVTNKTMYVDFDSYNSQVASLNKAPYVTACPDITGGTHTAPTSSAVTVSWNADAGASGYEYANTTSGTPPLGAGTFVATNTVGLTGLAGSTPYYFWVKKICIGGLTSNWVAITYTTA